MTTARNSQPKLKSKSNTFAPPTLKSLFSQKTNQPKPLGMKKNDRSKMATVASIRSKKSSGR